MIHKMNFQKPYIALTDQSRDDLLIALTRQDAVYRPVIQDLEDFGFIIQHRFFGNNADYSPYTLCVDRETVLDKDFAAAFDEHRLSGVMRCRFQLPARQGAALNAHFWLHELMHFFQDMHGLFLMPLERAGLMPVLPDAAGAVRIRLFCEAMAEVEALRASWRLKEAGHPAPWRGALWSMDWRGLARRYQNNLKQGNDEVQAAVDIFMHWYKTPQRRYYEKRALIDWQENMKRHMNNAALHEGKDILPFLRMVTMPALLNHIPDNQRPPYLSAIDWDDPLFAPAHKSLDALERRFGRSTNPQTRDIEIGSPPYLWKRWRENKSKW